MSVGGRSTHTGYLWAFLSHRFGCCSSVSLRRVPSKEHLHLQLGQTLIAPAHSSPSSRLEMSSPFRSSDGVKPTPLDHPLASLLSRSRFHASQMTRGHSKRARRGHRTAAAGARGACTTTTPDDIPSREPCSRFPHWCRTNGRISGTSTQLRSLRASWSRTTARANYETRR